MPTFRPKETFASLSRFLTVALIIAAGVQRKKGRPKYTQHSTQHIAILLHRICCAYFFSCIVAILNKIGWMVQQGD